MCRVTHVAVARVDTSLVQCPQLSLVVYRIANGFIASRRHGGDRAGKSCLQHTATVSFAWSQHQRRLIYRAESDYTGGEGASHRQSNVRSPEKHGEFDPLPFLVQ